MLANLVTVKIRNTQVDHLGITVTLCGESILVPNSGILDFEAHGDHLWIYVSATLRRAYTEFLHSLT